MNEYEIDATDNEYELEAKHFKIIINCRVAETSENYLSS
jgi:hypothetical protein